MATGTSTRVEISSEAANHVAKLGMESIVSRLLDHTRRTVTGLRQIRVELAPPHDSGGEDAIVIEATRDLAAHASDDTTANEWGRWFVATFPPEVRQHFSFVTVYGSNHAG